MCDEQERRISKLLAERTAEAQKQIQLHKKAEGSEEVSADSSIAETTRRIQQLTKQAAEEVNASKIF